MYDGISSRFDYDVPEPAGPEEAGEYTLTLDILGVTVKILVTLYKDEDGRSRDLGDFDTLQNVLDEIEWLGTITSRDSDYVRRIDVDDGFDESGADLVYRVDGGYDGYGFELYGGPDDGRAFDLLREKGHEAEVLGHEALITADWDELGRGSVCIDFQGAVQLWVPTPDWNSFATLVAALDYFVVSDDDVGGFPYYGTTIGEAIRDLFDE